MIKISKKNKTPEVTSFFVFAAAPPFAAAAYSFHHPTNPKQRHRGYYDSFNGKVDRKVTSPVLCFFFVFALCVIYVPGFFVADFSPLRTTNYRSRLRRPAKLVWLDSPFRRGLLRFVFFSIIPGQPS